jgi:hypothetical protein
MKKEVSKLPASEFDKIYEACMKSGGGERGQYKGHTFYGNVWHKIGPSAHTEYVRTFGGWNKDLLEAYRTGEIRDRGPMDIWYQLDPAVFDELVDAPEKFAIEAPWDLWQAYNHNKITIGIEQIGEIMVSNYRAGIIRKGGAMEEEGDGCLCFQYGMYGQKCTCNYDHAFSVKDGRMVVDWDALTVTKENALEISIASWKWLHEWLNENEGIPKRYEDECGLCQMYFGCSECPIMNKTKRHGCGGTPFVRYINATNKHEALDACRDEIAFLEGLR